MMNSNQTKKSFRIKVILLSIGVGVLVVSLSVFLQTRENVVHASAVNYELAIAQLDSERGAGSSYEVPGNPVRLRIPAIGVDAHIQSVGLSWRENGEMAVPTNFTDVGWYNGGPRPGMPGNAVIDGHLDGKDVAQAVFFNLKNLKQGDVVNVEDMEGTIYRYRVVETKVYDYDAPATDVFVGDSSKSRLNLITCIGDWDRSEKRYDKRIVVFTELVTN